MQFEFFLTRRLALQKSKAFSRLVIRIATMAIALSLAVMIITSALVKGFQETITDKIYGFMGHLIVNKIDMQRADNSFDDLPVSINQDFYKSQDLPGVRSMQVYARKAGIIKTRTDIEGIIVRGIGSDFDWESFGRFIEDGQAFHVVDSVTSNQMMVSRSTARRLKLKTGDPVAVYFIDQDKSGNPRQRSRRFELAGIYNTGLEEFDRLFALIDIGHVRKINQWESNEVGGFEVFLDNPMKLDAYRDSVDLEIGPFMKVSTIREIQPNIFDWISLQRVNEQIIIFLMMLVAIINMITSLLILILERTNMIGLLKALGSSNWQIRRVFVLHAIYIVGVGLLWGNLFGIGLALLQQHFGIIQLPEASYYVKVAPISLDITRILFLNVLTMVVCALFLILPSYLISRVDPIKAIRFS